MTWIAYKMLVGNSSKFYAIIFGVAFAAMLMSQQMSIFVGLMRNTASQIRDIRGADIWVMDRSVQNVDDITPMRDSAVYRVRGVPGVDWAVRLYKGQARAQFREGKFKSFITIGLDDQTLVGAPTTMLLGSVGDLRRPDAVILDEYGFRFLWPTEPLSLGKEFEMNDHRAVVVGICKSSPTFQTLPVTYMTYSQAVVYAPQERRVLSFVLAKPAVGHSAQEVCDAIQDRTGYMAFTQRGFEWFTISYYLRRTGIPINFGITVALGFIIGSAIAGQTFYLFTLDNLKQYGALKAMGLSNRRITGMVLLQGLLVGLLGYCLGMGMAAGAETVMAMSLKAVPPAAYMAWQIPLGSAAAIAVIVLGATAASLPRVLFLEPAVVFR